MARCHLLLVRRTGRPKHPSGCLHRETVQPIGFTAKGSVAEDADHADHQIPFRGPAWEKKTMARWIGEQKGHALSRSSSLSVEDVDRMALQGVSISQLLGRCYT